MTQWSQSSDWLGARCCKWGNTAWRHTSTTQYVRRLNAALILSENASRHPFRACGYCKWQVATCPSAQRNAWNTQEFYPFNIGHLCTVSRGLLLQRRTAGWEPLPLIHANRTKAACMNAHESARPALASPASGNRFNLHAASCALPLHA